MMTHDYKRHGTTTLFEALNVLDGQVIAQCQPPHRHTEWLRFLRQIDQQTPPEKILNVERHTMAEHRHVPHRAPEPAIHPASISDHCTRATISAPATRH
jgi:hypothetical protein